MTETPLQAVLIRIPDGQGGAGNNILRSHLLQTAISELKSSNTSNILQPSVIDPWPAAAV